MEEFVGPFGTVVTGLKEPSQTAEPQFNEFRELFGVGAPTAQPSGEREVHSHTKPPNDGDDPWVQTFTDRWMRKSLVDETRQRLAAESEARKRQQESDDSTSLM